MTLASCVKPFYAVLNTYFDIIFIITSYYPRKSDVCQEGSGCTHIYTHTDEK